MFNGEVGILDDDPQGSPGNLRVVGYGQRAPDRMPEVDMTSFLVIHDISEFAQCPDNVTAGEGWEVCPSYVNGDKCLFCTRPLIQGDAVAGERA